MFLDPSKILFFVKVASAGGMAYLVVKSEEFLKEVHADI